MNGMPDLLAPDPVVDELGRARDEIGRLEHGGTGLLDRDTVLALLRRRIDDRVFGAPPGSAT